MALSAGDPTARRRRRSSAISPIATQDVSKQTHPHDPLRSRLAGMWQRLRRVGRGGVGEAGSNGKYDTTGAPQTPRRYTPSASQQESEHREESGLSASTTRPTGSRASLRAPPTGMPPSTSPLSPGRRVDGGLAPATPGGLVLGKASSGMVAITEPRRASLEGPGNGSNGDGVARLELARQQNPRYSSRAGPRGLPPPGSGSLPTNSPAALDAAASSNDGRVGPVSPFRSSAARRRGGSGGGGGFGAGSPKRGQPAGVAVVEPRIPIEDFEACGGGNFAVFLAVRWVSSNSSGGSSGSSGGESGFEMLVRLALREGRHSVLGAFAYWRPGAERRPPSRRGSPDNDQSQGVAGKDGHHRQSSLRLWDMSATGRSNSLFSSPSVGDGVGSGRAQQLSAAVAGGHQISALITGVLRDNFLAQVGTGLTHRFQVFR